MWGRALEKPGGLGLQASSAPAGGPTASSAPPPRALSFWSRGWAQRPWSAASTSRGLVPGEGRGHWPPRVRGAVWGAVTSLPQHALEHTSPHKGLPVPTLHCYTCLCSLTPRVRVRINPRSSPSFLGVPRLRLAAGLGAARVLWGPCHESPGTLKFRFQLCA